MAASVLHRSIAVRSFGAFVRFREMLDTECELARKLLELGKRLGEHDDEIAALSEAIRPCSRRSPDR